MIIERSIEERRHVLSQDRPERLKEQLPYLVAEFIEREKTDLAPDFFPWAPGLVIASDYLLQAAGYCRGSRAPAGWKERNPDVFTKLIYGNELLVRGCGEFWTVERQIFAALALPYGPLPMLAPTRQAAMRLAEYCHPEARDGEYSCFPRPRGVASGLRWVLWHPDDFEWV